MAKTVDYFFTPNSPWTYLGHERFRAMAKRHGAAVNYKPADFGKVFAVSGGLPLAQRAPQRQAYRLFELARWKQHLGVPLNIKPKFFPVAPELAARLIIAAEAQGADPEPLAFALMRACWVEERNLADPATLAAIANEQKLPGDKLVAAAQTPASGKRYEDFTQEAIDRQVFGAPFFIYKGEPFWGQDRLEFLDRALAA